MPLVFGPVGRQHRASRVQVVVAEGKHPFDGGQKWLHGRRLLDRLLSSFGGGAALPRHQVQQHGRVLLVLQDVAADKPRLGAQEGLGGFS